MIRETSTPRPADRSRVRGPLIAAVLLCLFGSATARGAARFDPALRFREIHTPHFVIYFHQGEERAAGRLATIAEDTWRALQQPLRVMPPARTHVVLADQSEFANGFATPVPYDTVVIYTVWPPGTDFNIDDWLRLAFTHEFTHIVHLDRSEGWARVARRIFGRTSYAFPNLFLPLWQIEGIATYEESALTGVGRLHAGDFRVIVDEAARRGRLEPLDRVNGGITDWPDGAAQYAYGAAFHDYLAKRFGAESLAALADATARRFPYTSTRAFRYVYGLPLGDLWRDFEADAAASARSVAPAPSGDPLTQLTHHGFTTSGPRFDRFSCAGCPPRIVYSSANPHDFPSLNEVELDGSAPRRLTTRYLGSTTAIGRDEIYFDQAEVRRNVGLYNDLYVLSRTNGRVRRLTSGARLRDPDLSPDGTTIVAAQARTGQRDLVTLGVERPRSAALARLVSEPDVYFDAPRWSPDGRSIAVERHRLGALPEVVVVDVVTRAVRVVASDARTRFVMPAWRPDAGALVVAAGAEDDTFNLFEIELGGSGCRQLTHTSGSTFWPDVSPDGRTLAFAGYTTAGYDIFSMPYPQPVPGSVPQPAPAWCHPGDRHVPGMPGGAGHVPGTSPRTYDPLPTLTPTSWAPLIVGDAEQVRFGAAIAGVDVLGYHRYALDATWLVSRPVDAPAPNAALPDWSVFYAYDRWRPTLYAAASSTTSFFTGPPTDLGTPSADTRRERTFEAGLVLPFVHTRASHAALVSIGRTHLEDTLPGATFARTRTPVRAGWQTATAHTYGYSISRERGVLLGATAEIVRGAFGSPGDATTTTADARAYLPGVAPHHVVALRASGGLTSGDVNAGRTFLLGGDQSDAGVLNFGSRASSLLRGFPDAAFAGSRVALVNAEYRWPIARPQRGIGTWPILLHTVHAAAFAEAGNAWTRTFRGGATKISVGAELSSDIVLGFFARVTVTGGAAFGHDGAGLAPDRTTAYVRIGRSF